VPPLLSWKCQGIFQCFESAHPDEKSFDPFREDAQNNNDRKLRIILLTR